MSLSAESLPPQGRAVILILLIATFVVILNETILNVALPRLMVDLKVTAGTAQWLSTAFMLTMAVVIPVTGFLLQRLSTRTVFISAMALFCVGTGLAAISPGFVPLLLARIVQASGTAIMLPLLITTVLTLVPERTRGAVMGQTSIVISVAPAIGPTISGLILQTFSWRAMFLFVLPIALGTLFYGARMLRNVGTPRHLSLDVLSVLLSALGFGGLVYALSRFGEDGLGNPGVSVPLMVGTVALVAFLWRQAHLIRTGEPLLDLRAFGFPVFTLGVGLMVIAMMALFGGLILLPLYLQNLRGLNTLQTGLLLLPGGLVMGLCAPAVGRLYDRLGPRPLVVPGSLLMTAVLFGLGRIDAGTPIWTLLALHLTLSAGLALLFTPVFTSALSPLPPQLYSHGSAILSTLQQVAGAAGVALLVTLMVGRTARLSAQGSAPLTAQIGGLQLAFTVAGVIAALAVILAVFLKRTPQDSSGEPLPQPSD
ncbi:DHA2 family efflux MFS transporter permease subunit [Deinococcus humi]|uniref:DHA2 family lincomycin resistance protein-like MFS transporter n=1 Tax=Deinococcus humi TaxID=662880 RepID=A0A7W8K074_9DEIO|nr:DHA2 family efflux MFS transporter permease subunit [Deinococcus humi]MBB5366409.1 DHA2 family lincomycin resistance protein-like MFS transporter [Deinococcus humi]GGO41604.1 MFS transporter [Deinococcus humi]